MITTRSPRTVSHVEPRPPMNEQERMGTGRVATFLNWNFERRPPHSQQAVLMLERGLAQQPDVICLTEAHHGSTGTLQGHEITDRGATWSTKRDDAERLVVLWSATPWRDVDVEPNEAAVRGGYVSGVTETPVGLVRVVGICAPHHFASRVGAAERARLWTEQIAFWNALEKLLSTRDHSLPTVMLGDYNQYVPRIWGSRAAEAALRSTLGDLCIATGGPISGIDAPTIDHVAHTPDLESNEVIGLSRFSDDGRALSDHFGVVVRLGLAHRLVHLAESTTRTSDGPPGTSGLNTRLRACQSSKRQCRARFG